MKIKIFVLSVVLIALQSRLWFGDGNVFDVYRLSHQIEQLEAQVEQRVQRNEALELDVLELKNGNLSIESRARSDLSMIKRGETFYRYMR